jgi:histidyl-tRNA synthetase
MRDVYSPEIATWQHVESVLRRTAQLYGYNEIRTPVVEATELFLRGVGDTTDIVQKEMYTFDDKGGRSMSLRPELTAGVARAFVERGMAGAPQPTKLWYMGTNFRYEKPESGRYRQHSQFGVEVFGASSPAAEAEVIAIGMRILQELGLQSVQARINTIGCTDCRKLYHYTLREYLRDKQLCPLCISRMEKNPLRVLDCKDENCTDTISRAPKIMDSLGDECRAHFSQLCALLNATDTRYTVDSGIVRGLDYYTRTVFEYVAPGMPSIGGGGRYDGLIAQVGGPATPGVGFGMGMERLVMLLENSQTNAAPTVFVGHMGEAGFVESHRLVAKLRAANVHAEGDLLARSVKAQMKYADKTAARHTIIIGDSELESGTAQLKNMQTGEIRQVQLQDIAAIFSQ